MKKFLSLFLSAALLGGAASAAPLAKRIVPKRLSTERLQMVTSDPREADLGKIRPHRSIESAPLKGIPTFLEPGQTVNRKAAKSATAAQRAISASVELFGQVAVAPDLTSLQFYKFNHNATNTVADFTAMCSTTPGALLDWGAVYNADDNTISGFNVIITQNQIIGGAYYEIDLATGAAVESYQLTNATLPLIAFSVAKDPVSGRNYGYFWGDGDYYVWGYVDYASRTLTSIKDITDFNTCPYLGVTSDGEYYGITGDGNLVKIDKTTGDKTLVGALSNPLPEYRSAACMNTKNNTMLMYVPDPDSGKSMLWEIDLTTAAVTTVATYPVSQFYTMFAMGADVDEKAPEAPQLTMAAPEGTMTVTYTITLPTMLNDGTPITGALDWTISSEGQVLFEGKNMAGTTVTGDLTLTKTGMTEFVAVCSNASGTSAPTKVSIYIGKGLPAAPTNVVAAWADGKMTLTWKAVTGSEDGGYINPAEITYDVIDGTTFLAKDLTATTVTLDVPMPETRTSYTYYVLAKYDGKSSEMGTSNTVTLGAYSVPFSTTFNSTSAFTAQGYTVLDANKDNKTWTATATGARYTYNTSKNGDDWLFTPELRLEAGMIYPVTIVTNSYSASYPEKIEVKAGQGLTAAAMTLDVIPATVVATPSTSPLTLKGFITPTTSGSYNVGLHAISDKDQFYLYVRSLDVEAGMPVNAPKAVTNLVVTPDANGALRVGISATAPSETIGGDALSGDISLQILRDGEVLTTLSATPGAKVAYTDSSVPALGTYTYEVVSLSGDGDKGLSAEQTVYVGPYPMAAPTNIRIFETNQPGTATVLWDAVTTDINGKTVPASNVKYMVYSLTDEGDLGEPLLDAPTSATMATIDALNDPSKQDFVQVVVGAYNQFAEPTEFGVSNMVTMGTPYAMPVNYTGLDSLEDHILGVSKSASAVTVSFFDENSFTDGQAGSDGSEYFGVEFTALNQWGAIFTGVINLTTANKPEAIVNIFKITDEDVNMAEVIVMYNNTETVVYSTSKEDMEVGWNKVRVDLSEFKGKNVQIKLRATCKIYTYSFFDDLTIKETPENDLEVAGIFAPLNVKQGEKFDINVEVGNIGFANAGAFTVNLYRDGDLLTSRDVAGLDAFENMMVIFDNVISYFDNASEQATYSAEIVYAADQDTSNNTSEDITVYRQVSNLPTVNDLAVENESDGVNKLTWTPYVFTEGSPVAVTETFEETNYGDQAVPGWTMLDMDGKIVGGFQGMNIPGLATGEGTATFFIMDASQTNSNFEAASGNKSLCSMFNYYGETVNDWAISPLLPGQAQTISFYAKSYSGDYPETVQVWVTSEESVDPADYTKVAEYKNLVADWTKYEVELPEGTTHFALVSAATDAFMLMIDDVSFIMMAGSAPYELIGYDIYRDGVKINTEPVTEGEYTDTDVPDGSHTYHVVGLFDQGDSELSNAATIENSGLDLVAAAGLSIKVEGYDIVVTGAGDKLVTIAAVDGRVLYRNVGDARLTVVPAIYLVNVADTTTKLLVK